MAQHTHVVSYDRAGLGQSTQPAVHTLSRIISDLVTLLQALAIPPPSLFVGHSLGGLIVQHLAQLYPSLVGGVVLLDAPHPRQIAAFQRVFATFPEPVAPVVARLRHETTIHDSALHPEGLDFTASLDLVAASPKLPPVPLTVISRGRSIQGDIPELPTDLADKLDDMWHTLQENLAQSSPTHSFHRAAQSGHYIHYDQPELVLTAILDLLQRMRGAIPFK